MTDAMEEFVQDNCEGILSKPLENVANRLQELCSEGEEQWTKSSRRILLKLKEEYELAILGREIVIMSSSDVPLSLKAAQEKIREIVLKADAAFDRSLLSRNVTTEPPRQSPRQSSRTAYSPYAIS
jgi:hypothetical protein